MNLHCEVKGRGKGQRTGTAANSKVLTETVTCKLGAGLNYYGRAPASNFQLDFLLPMQLLWSPWDLDMVTAAQTLENKAIIYLRIKRKRHLCTGSIQFEATQWECVLLVLCMRLSEAGFFLDGRILYRAQIYVNSTWILHCTSDLHDALDKKKILDLLAKKKRSADEN